MLNSRRLNALFPDRRSAVMIAVIAALLAVGAGLWSWTLWPSPSAGRADPDDPGKVALGETVYRANCASCHGADLKGQPEWRIRKPDGRLPAPPHDETGHTFHHPDQVLFRITKLGVKPPLAPKGYESDMPGFGNVLADEEVWAVLSFIKSKWPPHILGRQQRIDEAARR